MKRRGHATQADGPREPAAGDPAEPPEHEGPRKHLRLAAADHPLSGRGRVAKRQREESRRQDAGPARAQQRNNRSAKADCKRRPTDDPPDPRRRFQRQGRSDRPHEEIEDTVGVRRFQEKVALRPGWIGRVAGFRQVDRFVDVRHGPCPGRGEHEQDQQPLDHGAEPSRRFTTATFAAPCPHL